MALCVTTTSVCIAAGGFVRKTDGWAAMARFDKDKNRTIDWFEADAKLVSRNPADAWYS